MLPLGEGVFAGEDPCRRGFRCPRRQREQREQVSPRARERARGDRYRLLPLASLGLTCGNVTPRDAPFGDMDAPFGLTCGNSAGEPRHAESFLSGSGWMGTTLPPLPVTVRDGFLGWSPGVGRARRPAPCPASFSGRAPSGALLRWGS